MSSSRWFYDRIAPTYDLFDLVFYLGRGTHPRRVLTEAIPPGPLRLLDVCVGTGASARVVARARPEATVIGIDLSEGMLGAASRKITRAGLGNLTVQRMDATHLAFGAATFDAVMSSFALHEIAAPVRARILAEVSRVLRPSGRFYLLDFGQPSGRRSRVFNALWGQMEPPTFGDYLRTDWAAVLPAFGLRLVEIRPCAFSQLVIAEKA